MQGIRINNTIFPLDTLKIHNVLYVLTFNEILFQLLATSLIVF
jgi:hypothetical protein